MTTLKFADTHNMVAFLSKPTESDGFEQIVDFLNAHPIRHALTINPTIYISCIEQFWSTIVVKTINGEAQLHALVDGKKIIITEASVRSDLQLADEEGVECLPNSTIFEQLALMGKPRKDTQVPQPSDPTKSVPDETVHKELGNSLVRATTTASSLEAEQDNNNINKTQSKATPNESSSLGTTSGGGPKRVKKLEKKNRSRTHKLKRLYKVGLTARVESSDNEESLGEDASKQGRIDAINADEEITLVSVQNVDEEMFDVNVLDGKEVFVAEQEVVVNDVSNVVSTAGDATIVSVATTNTATITTVDGITLAQALIEIKSTKPKEKRVVIQELGESTTTISLQQSQDKGKGTLIESVKPIKKKDLIRLDEEVALKLQAKFDEEERLAREKAEKEKEANIALIET
ncbi:hypothetical protein Tco_0859121 [Tanacetum coccineum]|uniref:Xylulose kinase-1 n=1 Tax=Tanacetum coccineum TaxID=301880 RepID=A0ABQ5BCW0_9ASTR